MQPHLVMVRWPLLMLLLLWWGGPLKGVSGHGMLLEPPGRSSMWRLRDQFPLAPPNYDDNAIECGGKAVLYQQNRGKCGVCGDAYNLQQPRPNEAGGKFGLGVIVRSYRQGDVIDVTVKLTDNLLGYFLFKLCPNNDITKVVTQECLDTYGLEVLDDSGQSVGEKYVLDSTRTNGDQHLKVQLPKDVTCSQCVLQWTYHAGNAWGCEPDGTCGKGLGDQEIFINCADIAIAAAGATDAGRSTDPLASLTVTPQHQTTAAPAITFTTFGVTSSLMTSRLHQALTTTGRAGGGGGGRKCHDVTGRENLDEWCVANCAAGFCPANFCSCD